MPAITSIVIIGTITVADVLIFAATVALSYVISSLTQPDGLRGTNQQDPGVRAQVPPDTTNPLPVVYGDAYIGGRFVDAVITNHQNVMFYVQAISCASPNGQFSIDYTKIYYGDRLCTFSSTDPTKVISLTDGAGNVDTSIVDVNGESHLRIFTYKSDYEGNITPLTSDTAMPWDLIKSTGVDAVAPANAWPTTGRRMNGLVFSIVYLWYSRDAGTTQLQPITYHCTQNLYGNGKATPGAVWVDYMTNNVYGAAVDIADIDSASALALDVYSDELITFNNYSGGTSTQPRYRINGVIDTGKNVLRNIDDIMMACDSWMSYNAENGKWAVVINKATDVSLALNDDNIIGSINVGTIDITQSPNVVEAKFPDSTNRDQYNYVTEFVPVDLLYPNEPVNKQTLTYELVNNSVQALYLANRVLEQGREDLTVTINTTYVGIQLSAGDVVSVTNSAYGWNNKLFRCMQVREAVTENGSLGAQLQLFEYNAQVYDNFDINQFAPAGNSNLPSPSYFGTLIVPTITGSEPYAVLPSFDVNCTIPSYGRVSNVTLYYTTSATPTDSDWNTYGVQSLASSVVFSPNEVVTFSNIYLTAGTYYFAYKVGNNISASKLSPMTTAFVWAPDPTSIRTFQSNFVPAALQVPYNGTTPDFTGVTFQLYAVNGLGPVNFVTAQTDADASFTNNSWRIGNSSTTGFGDIVKTNITVGNPTDGGTYAQFPQPTAMSDDVATVYVPIRYKDSDGDISQATPSSIQITYAQKGDSGSQGATATLYQWSTSVPSNPSGASTYTWATATNASYTGGGGWSTTLSTNPGTPLIQLYTATKQIVATAGTLTSTVSWASGYSVQAVSQNGANGVQAATASVYKWSITIPTAPTGTSTYTWSGGTISSVPTGWSASSSSAPDEISGYTLWKASVDLVDSVTATTTTINWSTSKLLASGYVGVDNGISRTCYSSTNLTSLNTTPTTITTTGKITFPANNSWGTGTVWTDTPPIQSAGYTIWQSDGIYNPTTNNTYWNLPYLSTAKIGSLSTISSNTGNLTVTGTLQSSTAAPSGTTMTGAGAVIYPDGRFVFGNSTGNITYNGTQTTINGALVGTNNILANAVTKIGHYFNTTAVNCNGLPQNVAEVAVTNTSSVTMIVNGLWTCNTDFTDNTSVQNWLIQGYGGNNIYYDYGDGNCFNTFPALSFYDTIAPGGSVTYVVFFNGTPNVIQCSYRSLTLFGFLR